MSLLREYEQVVVLSVVGLHYLQRIKLCGHAWIDLHPEVHWDQLPGIRVIDSWVGSFMAASWVPVMLVMYHQHLWGCPWWCPRPSNWWFTSWKSPCGDGCEVPKIEGPMIYSKKSEKTSEKIEGSWVRPQERPITPRGHQPVVQIRTGWWLLVDGQLIGWWLIVRWWLMVNS